VPVGRGDLGFPAAVSIDARFGDYRQAIALRGGSASAWRALEVEEVINLVEGERFELPERAGRLLVRPEAMCVHPTLVWRPCRESLSPFYPFSMITVGDWRIFVRVADGAIFTHLTIGDHGI
jgi:hypothetical protein